MKKCVSFLFSLLSSSITSYAIDMAYGSDYAISRNLVTNGEFVNFLNAISSDIKNVSLNNGEKFWGVKFDRMNVITDGDGNYLEYVPIYDLANSKNIEFSNGSYAVKRGNSNDTLMGTSAVGAVLYCNWLTNGGNADSTYLTGAYDFTKGGDLITAFENVDYSGSAYRLPTLDETTSALMKNSIVYDENLHQVTNDYGFTGNQYAHEVLGDVESDPYDVNSIKIISIKDYMINPTYGVYDNEISPLY